MIPFVRRQLLFPFEEVEYQEKGAAPPNERTLLRKFRRLLKDFGNLGLDVRALLNDQLTNLA